MPSDGIDNGRAVWRKGERLAAFRSDFVHVCILDRVRERSGQNGMVAPKCQPLSILRDTCVTKMTAEMRNLLGLGILGKRQAVEVSYPVSSRRIVEHVAVGRELWAWRPGTGVSKLLRFTISHAEGGDVLLKGRDGNQR